MTKFLEKPAESQAESELSMPGLCAKAVAQDEGAGLYEQRKQEHREKEKSGEERYAVADEGDDAGPGSESRFLTIFGLYAINDPAKLWEVVDNALRHNLRDEQGNFSFTDVLNELRKSSGLKGYIINGCVLCFLL